MVSKPDVAGPALRRGGAGERREGAARGRHVPPDAARRRAPSRRGTPACSTDSVPHSTERSVKPSERRNFDKERVDG